MESVEKVFMSAEALLIRSFFANENVQLPTRNNQIGAIRRFLLWERDENKSISFDDMFFEYLIQYEEPSKTQGKAIPDEHLGKISEWLAQEASTDHKMDLTYTILHLALETEFRINQLSDYEFKKAAYKFPTTFRTPPEADSTSKGLMHFPLPETASNPERIFEEILNNPNNQVLLWHKNADHGVNAFCIP